MTRDATIRVRQPTVRIFLNARIRRYPLGSMRLMILHAGGRNVHEKQITDRIVAADAVEMTWHTREESTLVKSRVRMNFGYADESDVSAIYTSSSFSYFMLWKT